MKIFAALCLLLSSAGSLFADFAYVVNQSSNNVSIVDLTNLVTIGYVDNNGFIVSNPSVIHFSPDISKALLLSQGNNAVYVIDPVQNKIVSEINAGAFPFSMPVHVDISPDSTKAYVTNPTSNKVSIIDMATETVTGYVNAGAFPFDYPYGIQFSQNGLFAGVTNFNGNTVSVITVATDSVTQYVNQGSFPANGPIANVIINNTKAYVSQYNAPSAQAVSIVDLPTHTVTGFVNPNGFPFTNPRAICISNNQLHAYIQDLTTNQINIIDTTTNTSTGYINATFAGSNDFETSVDDTLLYVVNSNSNTMVVIDLTSNTQSAVVDSSSFPFSYPVSIDLASTISPLPPIPLVPTPPDSLKGFKKKNSFAAQDDLINLITWSQSTGPNQPLYYEVYRDEALTDLAGVVMDNPPLQFEEHNCRRGITYTYYVVAVDNAGSSTPAQVSISR
jgi:YVTN family beta-propeller protein